MADKFYYKLIQLRQRLDQLEKFYQEVAKLTIGHEALVSEDGEDYAVVYPSELGKALEKVDPEWYNKVKDF